MAQSSNNLIWVDLEMTGLDTNTDHIIEIATIVTDEQLNLVEEGPVIAIHADNAILDGMDEWNTIQHGKSGLVDRVKKSRYTPADAERMTLEFVQKHVPANSSPMCGSSICQDRRFMARLMPELEKYFHYRNLDVTTLKILVGHWAPGKETFEKESRHLALDDIRDSIEELKFYREKYLNI